MSTQTDPHPPKRALLLLGIDIEATGPHLIKNAPYALSSIIVDGSTNQVVSEFTALCKPDPGQSWDPDTYNHFTNDTKREWRETVRKVLFDPNAMTPWTMVNLWFEWLNNSLYNLQYHPRTHNLLPLVDTTFFDKSMVGVYLPAHCRGMDYLLGEYNPWNDIRTYYAGLAEVDLGSGRYTAKQLFDLVLTKHPQVRLTNFKPGEKGVPHDHNPLNDVKCIIFEFNKLRKALNLSL